MKKFQLAFLCCLVEGILSVAAVDWCKLDCNGQQNTLCAYRPQTNSGECKNIVMTTNPTVRKEILHKHNEYRNKMANGEIVANGVTWPKASDMRQMSWDYNLEKLALRWAQQCFSSPPHDKCRRTPEFKYNGQNKGWAGSTGEFPSPYGSFDGWVGEIKLTSPNILDSLGNAGGALHFTQVIWARSYKLGCATIHADQRGFKTTTIVCNYGPGGNIFGTRIYFRGEPCKGCPAGTSCKSDSAYPQLCAAPSDLKGPVEVDNQRDTESGSSKQGKEVTINESNEQEKADITSESTNKEEKEITTNGSNEQEKADITSESTNKQEKEITTNGLNEQEKADITSDSISKQGKGDTGSGSSKQEKTYKASGSRKLEEMLAVANWEGTTALPFLSMYELTPAVGR